MKIVKYTILKAKAWQLFILISIVISLLYIATEISFETIDHSEYQFSFLWRFLPILIIEVIIFYTWLWVLGSNIQSLLDLSEKRGMGFFNCGIIVSVLYPLMYAIYIYYSYSAKNDGEILFWLFFFGNLFVAIFPLYAFYIISKNLVSAERDSRSIFLTYLLFLFYYPIGVWWIQPRINKQFSQI